MNTQVESRLINRLTYRSGFRTCSTTTPDGQPGSAAIFVPAVQNPINLNVDPVIWELNGLFGYAMARRCTPAATPAFIRRHVHELVAGGF